MMEDKIIPDTENLYTANCIRTRSGIYMNVFDPTPEMVCFEDIAHALSMMPRFGGHLPEFYSVAQHSVLVSRILDRDNALAGLLHDASEAYLMDFPSPIKKRLPEYKHIETKLMIVIAAKFGFDYKLNDRIKEVDEYVLQWEWSRLMLGRDVFSEIKCLQPKEAKQLFIDEFFKITSANQLKQPSNGR